jgi:hypothetical protein
MLLVGSQNVPPIPGALSAGGAAAACQAAERAAILNFSAMSLTPFGRRNFIKNDPGSSVFSMT